MRTKTGLYTPNTRRSVIYDNIGMNDEVLRLLGSNALFTQVVIKSGNEILYDGSNTTVLGGRLSLIENLYNITPNTEQHLTLNSMMGITHSKTNDAVLRQIPRTCNYFMVGDGAKNPAVPNKIYQPKNYETKLYNAIPFRCVPFATDLSSEEQEQYRLRKIIEIEGEDYIAYYAKKFDPGTVFLEYNDSSYTPIEGDTVPVDEDGDVGHRLSGGSVLCYVQFTLSIDQTELKEWFKIKNGSLSGASMNEIGLVYGADVANSSDSERLELAGAELAAKVTSNSVPMDQEGSQRVVEYRVYAR